MPLPPPPRAFCAKCRSPVPLGTEGAERTACARCGATRRVIDIAVDAANWNHLIHHLGGTEPSAHPPSPRPRPRSIVERPPPHDCLFCRSVDARFTRVEHPIPESLGNDEDVIPPGFVCDACNQYFGSKVEAVVLDMPPILLERTAASIRTKKGRLPVYGRDTEAPLFAIPELPGALLSSDRGAPPSVVASEPSRLQWVRLTQLMLKMGLELLLATEFDPYDERFDAARRFARHAPRGAMWQLVVGQWASSLEELVVSYGRDAFGLTAQEAVYEYFLGAFPDGGIGFEFVFRTHVFGCRLDRPEFEHFDPTQLRHGRRLSLRDVMP